MIARLPSPATLLLEAWTSNSDTQKLVSRLLDIEACGQDGTFESAGVSSLDVGQRLSAFDSDMSVLSLVVTAIKTLKRTSPYQSLLTGSPGNIQELEVVKRDAFPNVRKTLMNNVFLSEEEAVTWSHVETLRGIDTLTGLECRRRQDFESIAQKLGVHTNQQLDIARHRMDPVLGQVEPLIQSNTKAQAQFRTAFLGTRICVS